VSGPVANLAGPGQQNQLSTPHPLPVLTPPVMAPPL
jgi:hypothetical protein